MNEQITIDDFPSDRANCATCTRKGGGCPRREKRYPNGYVKSSVNGDYTGIIYRCPNYTGPYETRKRNYETTTDTGGTRL